MIFLKRKKYYCAQYFFPPRFLMRTPVSICLSSIGKVSFFLGCFEDIVCLSFQKSNYMSWLAFLWVHHVVVAELLELCDHVSFQIWEFLIHISLSNFSALPFLSSLSGISVTWMEGLLLHSCRPLSFWDLFFAFYSCLFSLCSDVLDWKVGQ